MQEHHSISQAETDMAATALKNVPPSDRLIAGLYFYEGLTIEEIAEILDRPQPKIRQSLTSIFSVLIPDQNVVEARKSGTEVAHIL